MTSEATLQRQVCDYIRLQYPGIIFRSDFASGMKLSIGQAAKHKRLQSSRAYPDLFIAEPRNERLTGAYTGHYCGLFIELKAKTIYKKDGTLLANPHVAEQADMLEKLKLRGYMAKFAVGFDEAKAIIDEYLSD
jgi:hypothetical protein